MTTGFTSSKEMPYMFMTFLESRSFQRRQASWRNSSNIFSRSSSLVLVLIFTRLLLITTVLQTPWDVHSPKVRVVLVGVREDKICDLLCVTVAGPAYPTQTFPNGVITPPR